MRPGVARSSDGVVVWSLCGPIGLLIRGRSFSLFAMSGWEAVRDSLADDSSDDGAHPGWTALLDENVTVESPAFEAHGWAEVVENIFGDGSGDEEGATSPVLDE